VLTEIRHCHVCILVHSLDVLKLLLSSDLGDYILHLPVHYETGPENDPRVAMQYSEFSPVSFLLSTQMDKLQDDAIIYLELLLKHGNSYNLWVASLGLVLKILEGWSESLRTIVFLHDNSIYELLHTVHLKVSPCYWINRFRRLHHCLKNLLMSSVHNSGSVVYDCTSIMFMSWNLLHFSANLSLGRSQKSQGTIWGVWIVQDTNHAIIDQKFLHKTVWVGALFWWSNRSPVHHFSDDFHRTSYCKYWFVVCTCVCPLYFCW